MRSQRLVKDWGSTNAEILLIGEAPGREEARRGQPFVGNTGRLLFKDWCPEVGLKREDFRITNVYRFRPPNNKIAAIPQWAIEKGIEELHGRIAELPKLKLLVPTGNLALRACMRKRGMRITDYRGSILRYRDDSGRWLKMIPMFHPASTFYNKNNIPLCLADLKRIAAERHTRKRNLPVRAFHTHPDLDDAAAFQHECYTRSADVPLVIDIETNPSEKRILMVGFALSAGEAWVFPWTKRFIPTIKMLCNGPNPKVLQNGTYDIYYLAGEGVEVNNWQWDLLPMHHVLYPYLDHDLATMASVDSREPYWKPGAKDAETQQKIVRWVKRHQSWDEFLKYNCKDDAVTRELFDVYYTELVKRGKLDFFIKHYADLFEPIVGIMRHGIRMNQKARKRQLRVLTGKCKAIQQKLSRIAGYPLNGPKSLSTHKVQKFLYETLGLPRQRVRRTGKSTANEVALRRLQLRYPRRCGRPVQLILQHREWYQQATFLRDERVDADGRMRFSLGFDTATGRLHSKKNPFGGGGNSQNIPRSMRHLYRPDKGCILWEVDMSLIEGRICFALTGDNEMIRKARMRPDRFDMHKEAAGKIFEKPLEEVTKSERQFGKHAGHAAQRGMMGAKMSDELLKEGIVRTPEECQEFLNSYLESYAPIRDSYFVGCRERAMRYRRLVNSWGREWIIPYERMSDDLYRRAYSFLLQSECADLVNQYGLKRLWRYIKRNNLQTRINMHGHDSLVGSSPPSEVYRVLRFLKRNLERPRWYSMNYGIHHGRPKDAVRLRCPVEFKIGLTWKGDVEWKRLPSRSEVDREVQLLLKKRRERRIGISSSSKQLAA